jgi:hypothetical protein
MAHDNQGVTKASGQARKIVIRANHGIAHIRGARFRRHTDQPNDAEFPLLLDDIDTSPGMAARTDEDEPWLASCSFPAAKHELLGMLIKRCESDCAQSNSMRGQVRKGFNSCIKVQTGRVIRPASLVVFNTASRWSANSGLIRSVCNQ